MFLSMLTSLAGVKGKLPKEQPYTRDLFKKINSWDCLGQCPLTVFHCVSYVFTSASSCAFKTPYKWMLIIVVKIYTENLKKCLMYYLEKFMFKRS